LNLYFRKDKMTGKSNDRKHKSPAPPVRADLQSVRIMGRKEQ